MKVEETGRSTAWRKWVIGALALSMLMTLVCAWGMWRFGTSYSAQTLQERVADLAARGDPVTLSDLRGERGPPANGASLIEEAYAALPQDAERRELVRDLTYIDDPRAAEDPVLRFITDEIDVFMPRLDVALACSVIRFDGAADDRFVDFDGSHLDRIEIVTNVLRARIDLANRYANRTRAVLPCIRRLLLLADRWQALNADEAIWAAAVRHEAIDLLRRGLENGDIRPRSTDHAVGDLLEREHLPRFAAAMRAERVWDLRAIDFQLGTLDAEFRDPTAGGAEALIESRDTLRDPTNVLVKSMLVRDMLAYVDAVDAMAEAPVEPVLAHRRLIGEKTAARVGEGHLTLQFHVSHVDRLHDELVLCTAKSRLARVALALMLRRLERGLLPRTLESVSDRFPDGGVPLDPYTDAAFVYELRDGETVLEAGRGADAAFWNLALDDPAWREDQGLVWKLDGEDGE